MSAILVGIIVENSGGITRYQLNLCKIWKLRGRGPKIYMAPKIYMEQKKPT